MAQEKVGKIRMMPWPSKLICLCARIFTAIILVMVIPDVQADTDTDTLHSMLLKLAPPPSEQALEHIPDTGRKLLALRSYLRFGSKIAERWSWTEAEIAAFQDSQEQRSLLAEIEAVNQHFMAANPGYKLYVHGTVRSLDEQIAKWNENKSVGLAAQDILSAYTNTRLDKPGPAALAIWLRNYLPPNRPSLAAPGLTSHGRALAIDFQIMKNGQIYAGANTKHVESLWRTEGWGQKLKTSITAAGPSFSGPLTEPDEPWHYDYSPPASCTAGKK
ncbi:hypothetical protein [Aestuariivirga sp.]|uniref:hypothetical protein n=1 Tax=Aestuariivirga sp. TaxID=2650926 RepID=UPI003BACAC10